MSTNKRIARSDKLAETVDEISIGSNAAAVTLTIEGLRQAVIALVEQQALANRIALGDFDHDELLKFLNA